MREINLTNFCTKIEKDNPAEKKLRSCQSGVIKLFIVNINDRFARGKLNENLCDIKNFSPHHLEIIFRVLKKR